MKIIDYLFSQFKKLVLLIVLLIVLCTLVVDSKEIKRFSEAWLRVPENRERFDRFDNKVEKTFNKIDSTYNRVKQLLKTDAGADTLIKII